MHPFLTSILVDPITGNTLIYDQSLNTLTDSVTNRSYEIVDGVPILLDIEKNPAIKNPALHHEFNSDFQYQRHYQQDARIFDYFNADEHSVTASENQLLHNKIIKAIPKNSSIILDVGCGNSWVAEVLIPTGRKVISMDISTINPVKATKKIMHENHAGLVADVFRIPIRKEAVDCIIASEIIEHVADPEIFITSLVNLLTPAGKLIITTPYNEKLVYSLCVHCNKPTPHSAHIHSFNEENLKNYITGQNISWSIKKFNNFYLIKTRIHVILKIFPKFIWTCLDAIMNKINNRAMRMMIEIIRIEKPPQAK
jgi:2-polyprenyl-3-methyl-5-hydroxy-6-metoxy-1,4-benzoquinol methylase